MSPTEHVFVSALWCILADDSSAVGGANRAMKRQIVFNVTGSPPRQGRLNEADLFTAGSPQVENVRTLLAAASAALRDSEAGPFDDEAYLHLRIILSDSDVPDLSDRLDVARAIRSAEPSGPPPRERGSPRRTRRFLALPRRGGRALHVGAR